MNVDGNIPQMHGSRNLGRRRNTHLSKLLSVLFCETKQYLLLLIVTGGTDVISFAPGSDTDAAAAAGRDPLAPDRDFLVVIGDSMSVNFSPCLSPQSQIVSSSLRDDTILSAMMEIFSHKDPIPAIRRQL